MKYLKQISYIKVSNGYQTYLFNLDFQPVRYKLLATKKELDEAIKKAESEGWKVVDATNATNRLRQQTRKK